MSRLEDGSGIIHGSSVALGLTIRQKQDRDQARKDASARNAIEGKFGEGKCSYGLGRIRVRLRETSESVITLQLRVMNLECKLRAFSFCRFSNGC